MTSAASASVLADRIRRAGEVAARHGVDLLLITPGTDLRYLLGVSGESHERLTCLVLPATGHRAPPALVVPRLEAPGLAGPPLDELGVEVVTWTDGEALTSEDVVTTFELIRFPATRFSGVWAENGGSLESVEAVDDLTVQFRFTDPLHQQWGERLYDVAIVPAHLWGDRTEDEVAAGPRNAGGAETGAKALARGERVRPVTAGTRGDLPRLLEAWRARLELADPEHDLAAGEAMGARLIVPGDIEWPTQLDDLGTARPYGLWLHGDADLRFSCLRSVAVVGSRAATAYGAQVAAEFGAALGDAGWTVVSGDTPAMSSAM